MLIVGVADGELSAEALTRKLGGGRDGAAHEEEVPDEGDAASTADAERIVAEAWPSSTPRGTARSRTEKRPRRPLQGPRHDRRAVPRVAPDGPDL
jgi:hypothetical protein